MSSPIPPAPFPPMAPPSSTSNSDDPSPAVPSRNTHGSAHGSAHGDTPNDAQNGTSRKSSAGSSSGASPEASLKRPNPDLRMARLHDVADRANAFAQKSRADHTKRAYRADWTLFRSWCDEHDLRPLPADPQTIVLYISDVADQYKLTTLERKLSAISQAHKTSGYESPALTSSEPLHSVWSGIARSKTRAKDKVAPALTEDIRLMVESLPRDENQNLTIASLRDRALLLVGFAGALRRSELSGLTTSDVSFTVDGLRMVIRQSKSDQEGRGHVKGLRYGSKPMTCPVRSLRAWLSGSGIDHGPIFRGVDRHGNIADTALTGQGIALIIKRCASQAGLNADDYSGHSLRAGFTTQAARSGTPERIIMRHTGHKSEKMVREYIREGALFNDNPTDDLGL